MRRIFVAMIVAAVAAGCSEHTSPAVHTAAVSVGDNFFSPNQAAVAVGDTVTWTWGGSASHNVTFDDGPASATQASGTYKRAFSAPGTYAYHCTIHGASMSGSIAVN